MKRSASDLTGTLRRLSARIWDPSGRGGRDRDRDRGHHLPASLASHEEDWDPDQPQIRMSRAFAVMLILHLVAVGGLFAFHVFGKDDQNAEQLATRQAHANATTPTAPPRALPVEPVPPAAPNTPGVPAGTTPPRAEVVSEGTPVDPSGNQIHTMLAGESKSLIAAKYGVSVRDLEQANPGVDVGKAGAKVVIPSPHQQRVIGATPAEGNHGNAPVAVIAATGGDEPGAREFAMKDGAENPYQNFDHEAAAPKEAPIPSSRSSQVSAKPVESKSSRNNEKPSTRPSDKPAVSRTARNDDDEDRPAKPKTQQSSPGSKPKSAPAGSRTHVVKSGDTVYNISRRYGMTPAEVMKANGISDPSKLQLGQVLKISVSR